MEKDKGNYLTVVPIQSAAILANDDKALQELYTANFYKTEAFVLANSGTIEEAKDIYQEAFVALWQNIKAGRFIHQNDSSLEAYLFQIAKYKWYDHLKVAKRINTVSVEDSPFIETAYNEEEEIYIEKVQQHLKNMGEPCKKVLILFYFMKKSMAEIATVFSWTEATARNNKYRCLQRLRNTVVSKQ